MKVGFRLAGIPWSGNVRKRTNVFKLNRHDDEWKDSARKAALNLVNGSKRLHGRVHVHRGDPASVRACCVEAYWTIPERARVTVTFEFPDRRRRDPDNYAAACKGLLDGLTGVLIADDSFEAIELVIRARHEPGQWHGGATVVEVEAL